ncbi:DUF1211 domain-containing protein [Microbacterium sp. KUDC0406]|uniref:TMEM175 family protein n=1 Tax=Microbacterium sp. KUDC0406 TaxID=2909588 RepID=UPI001F1C52D9|nr:TMEM175 family protein [Microbacterium sp. KUDC0406]UJP10345.1 DUF1211 domain-containing protein [Microbacterium sp. KUDC0406]
MTENPDTARVYRKPRRYGTGRMEALSDGVFAFAATLLVLDLVIPRSDGTQDLLGAFFDLWPHYLTYVISFATIGATWLAHNAICEQLKRADSTFLRLNLVLLLLVAFVPFPTRFLAEYISSDASERVAVVLYGVSFLLLLGMTLLLWWYARTHSLLADDEEGESRLFTYRLLPGIGVYVILICLGLVWPMAAVLGYLALALFFIVPLRRRRQTA